jgi:hypothetical protein
MRTTIKNFTGSQSMDVVTLRGDAGNPDTVGLSCYSGGLSLSFHMTASQAREMAAVLLAGAEEVEPAPTIETTHVQPPVPFRHMDWQATYKGYEPGAPIGYGATEQQAIEDIKDQSHAN